MLTLLLWLILLLICWAIVRVFSGGLPAPSGVNLVDAVALLLAVVLIVAYVTGQLPPLRL